MAKRAPSSYQTETQQRRCWSTDDLSTLRRLIASGWTDGQIGDALGRTAKHVQRKRSELQIAPGQSAAATVLVRKLRRRAEAHAEAR